MTYSMIIADDDSLTCEMIRKYLLHTFPELDHIWIARDGTEAFSLYEQYYPDIILTDIAMPKCDGLELTEKLHQSGYTPKIIIISAHKNFAYAQNAVRLGVEDYISKPILPVQLKEIISKVIDSLNTSKQFLTNINDLLNKHKTNLPVLRERFFNSLINEHFDEKNIMERARLVDIDLKGTAYTAAVLLIQAGASPEIKHTFANSFSNYLAKISDVLFPNEIKVFDIVIHSTDIVLIAVASNSDLILFFRNMNTVLNKLVRSIKKSTGFTVYAALGKQYNSVIGIRDSYREAMKILDSIDVRQIEPGVINYEEISPVKQLEFKVDDALEMNLLQGVKFKNYDQYVTMIGTLADQLLQYRESNFKYIKTYLLELSVIMFRELQKCDDSHTELNIDFYSLLQSETFEKCIDWFKNFVSLIIERYKNLNEEKGNALVNKAKRIIQSSLHKSDFSIDDVSSELYISSNYLRQIFKQQTGESFVEYLTRIRMQKAMSLLMNGNDKIQDIAEKTGFSNQRYFSVCFKNHFGLTPSEVRKNTEDGQSL